MKLNKLTEAKLASSMQDDRMAQQWAMMFAEGMINEFYRTLDTRPEDLIGNPEDHRELVEWLRENRSRVGTNRDFHIMLVENLKELFDEIT